MTTPSTYAFKSRRTIPFKFHGMDHAVDESDPDPRQALLSKQNGSAYAEVIEAALESLGELIDAFRAPLSEGRSGESPSPMARATVTMRVGIVGGFGLVESHLPTVPEARWASIAQKAPGLAEPTVECAQKQLAELIEAVLELFYVKGIPLVEDGPLVMGTDPREVKKLFLTQQVAATLMSAFIALADIDLNPEIAIQIEVEAREQPMDEMVKELGEDVVKEAVAFMVETMTNPTGKD